MLRSKRKDKEAQEKFPEKPENFESRNEADNAQLSTEVIKTSNIHVHNNSQQIILLVSIIYKYVYLCTIRATGTGQVDISSTDLRIWRTGVEIRDTHVYEKNVALLFYFQSFLSVSSHVYSLAPTAKSPFH